MCLISQKCHSWIGNTDEIVCDTDKDIYENIFVIVRNPSTSEQKMNWDSSIFYNIVRQEKGQPRTVASGMDGY